MAAREKLKRGSRFGLLIAVVSMDVIAIGASGFGLHFTKFEDGPPAACAVSEPNSGDIAKSRAPAGPTLDRLDQQQGQQLQRKK